ncbi:death-associated protein kinase 1-like isoform X2 [Photinus pyralis]|uniref:death-associated protein kinase 1-like isoform X2 n=1 Tax=Photinus pyralis TaxID=7054 RepID=UPI001267267E|nr:death-associated protein kinase 1-like isoform X2 [Photinus pyralis]
MSAPLSPASSCGPSESFEFTPLQLAAHWGNVQEVSGVQLDNGPDTALHLALRKCHSTIAILLLDAGANFELKDTHEDCPIHIACTFGLLNVVHTLCALGCRLEITDSRGLYPLHLAAKNGHTHVVRCLCAAGCNLDVHYGDNIRADITALKYGHNEIAELLDKLRATGQRDTYARQLVPTSKLYVRLIVRVFGNCGVGKTSLIKSLGAGLFSTLFRRSGSLQSNKSRPSSPISAQIEMDVTSRQNSLTFESSASYKSTKGIHIQNLEISNVGDVVVWEFSGQENYFPTYHHFLHPSPQTLTLVLFNLEDSPVVQVQQACFWINFIMAREAHEWSLFKVGPIVLVATHVDSTRAIKNQQGEWVSPDAQTTLETVEKLIPDVQYLHPSVIVMDSNVPASQPFKHLKSMLLTLKRDNLEKTIGMWTGLLESTLSWLAHLRKEYEQFPVIHRKAFYDLVRTSVNVLASDDHIRALLHQLHNMGEIFCINELVVISLAWFGLQLIGEFLSTEFLANVRATGVYTPDDFQASFNQFDALGTLQLMEALELCIQCEVDGETEYEFPIYNQTETLPGLWDSGDPRYRTTGACYGGVRLYASSNCHHLFTSIFPHIQIELRRAAIANSCNNDNDTDLYQWHHGSKLCTIALETLITLDTDERSSQYIEIKIRGPQQTSQYCFYFLENVIETVLQGIARVCPGLVMERHILSVHQLRIHCIEPYAYPSQLLSTAMLESESTLEITLQNTETEKFENVITLALFGDVELVSKIHWGCSLKVQHLPIAVKFKLARLLDPPHSHGRDWCLLALRLGLEPEKIATADSHSHSCTMRLLALTDCTIGALIANLQELGRNDTAEVVLRTSPLLQIIDNATE